MPMDLSQAALSRYVAGLHEDPVAISDARPVEGSSSKWPYLALLAGQGADAATTAMALQRPGAREVNPMGGTGTMLAKAGVSAGLSWLMHHEQATGHDTAAKVIGALGGIAGAAPAAWNIAQMRK